MKFRGLLFLLLIIGFFLTSLYFIPGYIRIQTVSCSSQFGPCNYDLQTEMLKLQGDTLKKAKSDAESVLVGNSKINDFTIRFKFPALLLVNVIERKPYFALKQEGSDVVALVDGSGMVVSFQKNTPLPTLTTISIPPGVGEEVESKIQFASELLLDMFGAYQTKTGVVKEDKLTVDLATGEAVIFPLEGDRQILIGSLTAILSRLKQPRDATRIEIGNVSEIDLRFKNPVIR